MSLDFVNKIKNMPVHAFIKYIDSLDSKQLKVIIDSENFDDLTDQLLNFLFFKSNYEIKQYMLTKQKLFDRIINMPPNKNNKTIMELVDIDVLSVIINNPYCPGYLQKIKDFLIKIKLDKFNELINQIDFLKLFPDSHPFKNIDLLIKNLKNHDVSLDIINPIIDKIKNDSLSPLCFLRTTNKEELLLLSKFGLLVNVDNTKEGSVINNPLPPFDLISKLNDKHLYNLAQEFKNKKLDSNDNIIIATTKLYYLFGYDNALKIIKDKFTYLTPAAEVRICDTKFKHNRQTFRLKHQNKFYYYGLEDDVLNAIQEKPINTSFFRDFVFHDSPEETEALINNITNNIKGKSYQEQKELIKAIIIEQINKREKQYKKEMSENLEKHEKDYSTRSVISAKEICKIFSNLDLSKPNLDKKGHVIPDLEMQKFILGNLKWDNDCLLRLVINQQALGLNNTLDQVINNFDVFKSIIDHSYNKLSLYSILDIIDISKIKLYNMQPDEQDITLETFSKIVKSKIYCNEPESEIIKRACALHRQRKLKISSSIPIISGLYNDFLYQIASFDDEKLLCIGIDSDNCLKVGGKGEDLLHYCLTSPHAVILYIYDKNDNIYTCPIIRSGNAIHGNGIDPEPPDDKKDVILKIVQVCFQKICELSTSILKNHEQNIEIATLTDLHMARYMKNSGYKPYDLQTYIPQDQVLYSDYNKDEIQNYILYQSPTYTANYYYQSEDRFFQPRAPVFKYNNLKEFDQTQINILINSIAYTHIDPWLENTRLTRKKQREFQPIKINDLIYIIGNKDWFIAVCSDYSTIECLLPYDSRARDEFYKNYAGIKSIIEELKSTKLESELNYGKNR